MAKLLTKIKKHKNLILLILFFVGMIMIAVGAKYGI